MEARDEARRLQDELERRASEVRTLQEAAAMRVKADGVLDLAKRESDERLRRARELEASSAANVEEQAAASAGREKVYSYGAV